MVNGNAFEEMLEVLKAKHLLKSWSIYNDRYTGDVVVRVRFMQGGEIGQSGEAVNNSTSTGTYKRKPPHQVARDQARADKYKQSRKALQNTSPNIGKTSLRNYSEIEGNRGIINISHYSPMNDSSILVQPSSIPSSPVGLSSPMKTPTSGSCHIELPSSVISQTHSPVLSPVRPPSPVVSPVKNPLSIISPVRSPSMVSHGQQTFSLINQVPPPHAPSPVSSPPQSPSPADNPPPSPKPTQIERNLDQLIQETLNYFKLRCPASSLTDASPD